MDLKDFRYFVSVAELGSFTLAARQLGIAQPALSRHIRELESECGAQLLRRNGRGAQLTDVGTMVFEHAKSMLEQVDRLTTGLKAMKGAPVGTVVIGMPPSVCMALVEPLFRRMRADFPGIRLHVNEASSGDVREWLVTGRLDVGILYSPGRGANPIGQYLLAEDMFLCRAPGQSRSKADTVTLSEAIKLPLILPGRAHGLRVLIDGACSAAGFTPNVILELDAMAVIKDLVRQNDGCTILPYGAVHREVLEEKLQVRRIVTPSITRSLVIAESLRRAKNAATSVVVRCVYEEVMRLVADGSWQGRR
jgi:LysR family transcriptional regulator, nitrogen assimilation regulatory protein